MQNIHIFICSVYCTQEILLSLQKLFPNNSGERDWSLEFKEILKKNNFFQEFPKSFTLDIIDEKRDIFKVQFDEEMKVRMKYVEKYKSQIVN